MNPCCESTPEKPWPRCCDGKTCHERAAETLRAKRLFCDNMPNGFEIWNEAVKAGRLAEAMKEAGFA